MQKLPDIIKNLIIKNKKFTGYSSYILSTKFYWSKEIKTACAGYGFIFINPDFWYSLSNTAKKTILAHEIHHLIFNHLDRSKGCDPVIYNIAADHVVNNILIQQKFSFKGLENGYMDPCFAGWTTEEVYNVLYKKRNEKSLKLSKTNIEHISNKQIKDLINRELEKQKKSLIKQKEEANKNLKDNILNNVTFSDTSGSNRIYLEIKPFNVAIEGVSYEKIFEKYLINPLSGGKRTFIRPNRRSISTKNKLILPGRSTRRGHFNRLTHLVYALDVSGSISKHQAQQFHNSVKTIKKLLNPEFLTVLFFDTKIVFKKTFKDTDEYKNIKVIAGGGTNLKDVWRLVENIKPEALVIFTDLYLKLPPEPNWDCIWLVPKNYSKNHRDIYGELYVIPEIEKENK